MRPRVLLVFLVMAGAVLGGLALLTERLFPPDTDLSRATAVRSNAARVTLGQRVPQAQLGVPTARPATVEPVSGNTDSTATLLAELEDPRAAVRQAALDRIIELDDRAVIPQLRVIADRTTNLSEKIHLLKAIEFLSLPSVEEHLAAQKTRRAARGLPETPPTSTNLINRHRRLAQPQ